MQVNQYSPRESANYKLQGGRWTASRLDISNGSEVVLVCSQGYQSVYLYPEIDAIFIRFDISTGSTIATAQDMILPANSLHNIGIPYSLGQIGNDGPAMHLKTETGAAGRYCRIVLT